MRDRSLYAVSLQVTAKEYMTVVEALQPAAFVALADEVPRESTQNRARASVDRTAKVFVPSIESIRSAHACASCYTAKPRRHRLIEVAQDCTKSSDLSVKAYLKVEDKIEKKTNMIRNTLYTSEYPDFDCD
eukprot:scaffold516909_cov32-Prasinocladus_malaysianus.AAC.1